MFRPGSNKRFGTGRFYNEDFSAMARICTFIAGEFLVFVVLLFGAAGTLFWPAAWIFLIMFFGWSVMITGLIARDDPALLAERMKPLFQHGQPLWDKIILVSVVLLFAAWLILMGLDAVRFRWFVMPLWLQWLGAAGVIASMWIYQLAFRANTFLANVVRIQDERGHKVVSTGPYGIVRHPLYAGVLLFLPMTALMLGSWAGLAFASLIAIAVIVRTALEDRELRRSLDGYVDNARRVRYRLLPGVW
jgi:protein-S-isoprenylcysteine O-methyltransferase Ste14